MMFRLPRRLAPLPLLLGTCYIGLGQVLHLGPLSFPVIRLLIAVGFIRVFARKERIAGKWTTFDRILGLWAAWSVFSLLFHKSSVMVFRMGLLYDALGAYYLLRVFIRNMDDVQRVFRMLCVLLVPVSVMMLIERQTGVNPFGLIGFGIAEVTETEGHYRAAGAFGHPILAGTVGAVCLPVALYVVRQNRKLGLAGFIATLVMVYACGSSGPIMATLSTLVALGLWKIRSRLPVLRWLTIVMIILLDIVMNDPVYFILARIDITGGSTGYFRAQLIRSSIEHLGEWWFAGTDYTRHWMPSGIMGNADHTDMTNYFIQMGVWGGLPLMLLFMWLVFEAFWSLGKSLRRNRRAPFDQRFLIWTVGAILFGHAATFISISYFDQTFVFLYMAFALTGAVRYAQEAPIPVYKPAKGRRFDQQVDQYLPTYS